MVCSEFYAKFKGAVKALKCELIALYYATQDPEVPWLAKLLALIALGYALSPFDLIPDCIPIIGLIDDLIILPLLLWLALRMIPDNVITRARHRAINEPFRLAKNVPAAVTFGAIWGACIIWLVGACINHFAPSKSWMQTNEWLILSIVGLSYSAIFGVTLFMILRDKPRGLVPLGEPLMACN
mmetsp:Transcript_32367/g.53583  ORF Transcript_32367/g.53583 Transcript_32367/m.53583 type:complete len:183 (-) Transcript_32367:314-862(-)|eukprot:CAMPEP_0119313504 /NCGR_PEP_ID=MMETSP1333-20130426/29333_1 /TAXON_ID=418940 /ORGANISM="Scyphosphaera apsteinii, Strain RCC1455" /LENGTH=182 /DNA_ID=CAMNT_0007318355 /DNA_START=181 /DNA_END=729 /DNA_ORIENTATION=+